MNKQVKKKLERQEEIKKIIRFNFTCNFETFKVLKPEAIKDLAEQFNVSVRTVQRDFREIGWEEIASNKIFEREPEEVLDLDKYRVRLIPEDSIKTKITGFIEACGRFLIRLFRRGERGECVGCGEYKKLIYADEFGKSFCEKCIVDNIEDDGDDVVNERKGKVNARNWATEWGD